MNCTTSGSACRLNAFPQSARGAMRWNGDGSSSGSGGTVRMYTRQRAAGRPLGRVAHLDRVAEPDPALGHPPHRELAGLGVGERRELDAALLSSGPSNSGLLGPAATCIPTALTRTLPAPSTITARVWALARPARTTSVSMRKPAIGTGRPSSTLMRASRWAGSVRSSARTSIAVGGPPWQAS